MGRSAPKTYPGMEGYGEFILDGHVDSGGYVEFLFHAAPYRFAQTRDREVEIKVKRHVQKACSGRGHAAL